MPRKEEYVVGDHISPHRSDAILATVEQIVGGALLYSKRIPPQYFVATAEKESNFAINEVDTEEDGFVSKGIFQLSDEEAKSVSLPQANLFDLIDSVKVFAKIQELRLDAIIKEANLDSTKPLPPDVWAYLSISHNQGPAATEATIKGHGLNWANYKTRNLKEAQDAIAAAKAKGDTTLIVQKTAKLAWWLKVFAYGDSCISGGDNWHCPC